MSAVPPLLSAGRGRTLWQLVGIGIAQALATIASAWLIHRFFDDVVKGGSSSWPSALTLLAALLAAGALLAGLRVAERSVAERMGQDYARELRLALFASLAAQSPRKANRRSRGGTLLRFIGDVKGVRRWVSLGLPRLAVGALSGLIALGALAMVNPRLPLAALAGFLLSGTALTWLGYRIEPALKETRRRQARLAADVNDRISAIAVVQVFDQVRRERQRLAKQSAALADAMVTQIKGMAFLRAAAEFGGKLAGGSVLFVGALEVAQGRLSVAELVGALTIVGLISPAFRDLGRVLGYWRSAQVSLGKIAQFLQSPRIVGGSAEAERPLSTGPSIEFRAVSVGNALREFSAVAAAGKQIAIIGPNGAGKSTLMSLVSRLVDPDAGEVLIDEVPAAEYPLQSLRRMIGAVTPDLPLMRGSIERNLRYRLPRAPEAELSRISALCAIDDILRKQPNGAQTRVADGGTNLSYGERQRIAWARALLGRPDILLLDEADANLDPISAHRLGKIITAFTGTVLMVTHQLSRITQADEIWYVEAGRLLESGTPDELLGRSSRTRRLFRRELKEVG